MDRTAARDLFAPRLAIARTEVLGVAHLDASRRLIAAVMLPSDSPCSVDLPLRRIVADAMRLNTRGLLIAHNHPSGDPRPSRADVEATRALVGVASPIGIMLYDHLVFAGAEHVSFSGAGLL
jgi:DNA repair protein RadC